jgi:hypothetical protein
VAAADRNPPLLLLPPLLALALAILRLLPLPLLLSPEPDVSRLSQIVWHWLQRSRTLWSESEPQWWRISGGASVVAHQWWRISGHY